MAIGDKIPVDAVKKALAENPVLKWVVVGFVAILAVEFLAKEGIGLWVQLETARATVDQKKAEALRAEVTAHAAALRTPDNTIGKVPETDIFGTPLKRDNAK